MNRYLVFRQEPSHEQVLRRKLSALFKNQVIKLVGQNDRPLAQVAEGLLINAETADDQVKLLRKDNPESWPALKAVALA